jgi:hypothetical protein
MRAGAIGAVPMHLISITDLPEFDKDGHRVRSATVDVESAKAPAGAAQV